MLGFQVLKTVKHYAVLGAYFGIVAAVIGLVRALPELPRALRESANMPWWDIPLGLLGLVAFFAALALLGAVIGGLVYWSQLYAEKRRHARDESLIVRR